MFRSLAGNSSDGNSNVLRGKNAGAAEDTEDAEGVSVRSFSAICVQAKKQNSEFFD